MPVFDNCTVVWVLPNRSLMALSPVELLSVCSSYQVHHLAHLPGLRSMDYDVNMVAGNAIPIDRHFIAIHSYPQPFALCIFVSSELQ